MNWLIGLIFLILPAKAHCPLCTAAAGAGVAITRFYGISDLVVGVWFGAFIISTALWANKALPKKIPFQEQIVSLFAFLITVIPFYSTGFMGAAENKKYFMLPSGSVYGVDALLLGMIAGWIVFEGACYLSSYIKKKKGLLYPYQTISFILSGLTLASLLFWVIG